MTTLTRDERFPAPMHHARQVEGLTFSGQPFHPGQRIAHDVRVYDYRKDRTSDERREATIVELWIEDWHGERDLPYAECLTDEGQAVRVWFHRDKPGVPTGFTGPIIPNALF
ncbi:MAG: hypothetical protein J0J04_15750 [Microbacterium sp.]|uniref:hypothetical protein n=1 Tax=Microbacterium sp. TaxID=51671 RepID=UPI001ACF65BC|nr:hypothetical protein [Microbacterium sp.]MBN9216229.1 hypothetical protein [Microbacterium sp.]